MKKPILLLSLLILHAVTGYSGVLEGLNALNRYWAAQPDVKGISLPQAVPQTDKDWIRLHLSLVERTLRARPTDQLSSSQKLNREKCLDILNDYWHTGNFPVNDAYSFRTPIFIDKYDNFCAVGYLIKATGHEDVSRMVAANTNLGYVKQMRYKELAAWADEYGFTADELAWIQPAYPSQPTHIAERVGRGTNGPVNELLADNDKLYVGGEFTMVDSTIAANNIAYVTESGGVYTWHAMGSGVNGKVNAIAKFKNFIYVAGHFSEAGGVPVNNVAYWDGANWHDAGCTYGTINDLLVFRGELYAGGDFDVCAALSEVNFAKWDSTYSMWRQFPALQGHVNTLAVMDTMIVIGGKFSFWTSSEVNSILWNPNTDFQHLPSGVANEVKDFAMFKDTMYAVCNRTAANDSMLVQKMHNGQWVPVSTIFNNYATSTGYMPLIPVPSVNTLCAMGDTLLAGGNFAYSPSLMPGPSSIFYSTELFGSFPNANFMVDDAINKITVFKNGIYIAGDFVQGNDANGMLRNVNHIAKRTRAITTSIPSLPGKGGNLIVYPNPVKSNALIHIENDFDASHLRITDLSGRTVTTADIDKKAVSFRLPVVAAGTYFLEIANDAQVKMTKTIIVE